MTWILSPCKWLKVFTDLPQSDQPSDPQIIRIIDQIAMNRGDSRFFWALITLPLDLPVRYFYSWQVVNTAERESPPRNSPPFDQYCKMTLMLERVVPECQFGVAPGILLHAGKISLWQVALIYFTTALYKLSNSSNFCLMWCFYPSSPTFFMLVNCF